MNVQLLTDGRTDRRMDGQTDGLKDGLTDGQTDIQTDTQKFGGYNIIPRHFLWRGIKSCIFLLIFLSPLTNTDVCL